MRRWLFGELNSTLIDVVHTLERMDTRLERMDTRLERMDTRLERMDTRLERTETLLVQESRLTRASVENNTRVTREILVELREQRPILERIDDGVHANTEGLMHVLDELRGGRGPGAAPAV